MKIRKDDEMENEAEARLASSQEMREIAEALSLYRSAMQHVAEKQAARPFVTERKPAPSFRMRLVMVPALAAALAVAVIVPTVSHLHGHPGIKAGPVAVATPQTPNMNVAQVDDTQLMNQIDSDLTEDVPDALQPLTDMGSQTKTANNSGAEKK
jgi:hypothetical protein